MVSKLRKRTCDAQVSGRVGSVSGEDLFLSVLVVGEIRRSIDRLGRRDPAHARVFEDWLAELRVAFADHVVPIEAEIAECWGRIDAQSPWPWRTG